MAADGDDDRSAARDDRIGDRAATGRPPRLGSRVLLTWLELTVVGITGGLLGATIGGPPGFVIYLTTTLLSVGVVFHNVNELIKGWLRATGADEVPEPTD
ncbi:hypothetical protein C488_00597 [Natrinema pellirubrum DSM 15624]|uniref:Uncharacterized protein n=1 Tax=Natrinema pellirubrum (strain DSM 15624 / CIP 106293 / JCM 10476 / NCIMB 786 / 157) TaxID=797303 RepID=L0JLC5_NATP1|nr:hypothetical protein [Natrinema pellirubrum]AGB31372.1 hypothetical protein Natpe_1470 [Natrinema pellirubrum DSM 15624]ELY82076.1 hypothetical protein C488_00597 [Natrinema pellirubrum DSM 15624]